MKFFIARLIIGFISLLLSFLSFGFFKEIAKYWIKSQIGVTLLSVLSAYSFASIIILTSAILFAKIFGRWYCSLICPFGILQDFILLLRGESVGSAGNWKKTRYLFTSILFLSAILGFSFFFGMFEPFTLFGKIAGIGNVASLIHEGAKVSDPYLQQIILTSLAVFFTLVVLVLWKGRAFCTVLCPVGTILGIFSKNARFQLKISKSACLKCKKCEKNCPAGCLNIAEKKIDYERCVLCFRCFTSCKFSAIKYGKNKTSNREKINEENQSVEILEMCPQKREFLTTILGVSGLVAGIGLRKSEALYKFKDYEHEKAIILPPGAGSTARFFSTCTGCQLCVANCTGKVLKPYKNKVKMSFTPDSMCSFECNNCSQVCPSGAIMPLTLSEKKCRRIGLVNYQPEYCIAVKYGYDCGACAEHCPVGALQMIEDSRGIRVPKVFEDVCIGCGSCEQICPAVPAVKIFPIPVQITVSTPKEFFKEEKSEPIENSGEWAF